MERNVLQERVARLVGLENLGGVFRDGHAIYLRARAFAIKAHLGQMHGDNFYTCHLEEVENVLIRFDCCSFRMRAAARLHDTVEKSDVTMSDINREFSGFVASLVDAVTSAPGKTREQRNAATYLSVKKRGGMAIVLKLADRIANVEETIRVGDAGRSMWEEEYSEFRNALYVSGNADAMWAHLDTLNEIGAEALNRRNLTSLANSLSSSNSSPAPQVTTSASHALPE
jgi:(p)ppGpp synthase/HD superfamily hydrolase